MSSKIDYGQVTVELGEHEYVMKPTLQAMRKIDDHFGSIRQAVVSVSSLSFNGIAFIIAHGAGLTDKGRRQMEEDLFASGVVHASGPVSEYLGTLMDPTGDKDGADEEEGEEAGNP